MMEMEIADGGIELGQKPIPQLFLIPQPLISPPSLKWVMLISYVTSEASVASDGSIIKSEVG